MGLSLKVEKMKKLKEKIEVYLKQKDKLEKLIYTLRPYHVTPFDNVPGILDSGKILSKNRVPQAMDIGYMTFPKSLFFTDITCEGQTLRYKYIEKNVNLDNFARFYLFLSQNKFPKFMSKLLGELSKRSSYGLSFVIFILKEFQKLSDEYLKKVEHYVVYGPAAGYGQLIEGIDNFVKYVKSPSPDPLKIALWNLLEGEVNPKSKYHEIIISSELVVKDEVPLEFVEYAVVFVDENFEDKAETENIKRKVQGRFGSKAKITTLKSSGSMKYILKQVGYELGKISGDIV